MKKIFLLFVVVLLTISLVRADLYTQNYTSLGAGAINPENAQFAVRVIKYEPYPVNPGNYFDLWIKVQNIGSNDAQDATFELIPKYPFTSTDNLVRHYGKIAGLSSVSGISNSLINTNEVVLKYRVKVADDATEGPSAIEFKSSSGGINSVAISTLLNIQIAKTGTDFDVIMQESGTSGTSFGVSNIGRNPATAVTFRVVDPTNFNVNGPSASIIGNLDAGDFTTVTFQLTPKTNKKEVNVRIDYTDVAGARQSINQTVPVYIASSGFGSSTSGTTTRAKTTSIPYLAIIISLVIGILLGFVLRKIMRRKKKTP